MSERLMHLNPSPPSLSYDTPWDHAEKCRECGDVPWEYRFEGWELCEECYYTARKEAGITKEEDDNADV